MISRWEHGKYLGRSRLVGEGEEELTLSTPSRKGWTILNWLFKGREGDCLGLGYMSLTTPLITKLSLI